MVTLTEKAAHEVKRFMTDGNCPDSTVLRITVVGGGCSGLQQRIGLDTNFDPSKDHLTEQHGVKVVVDKRSDLHLDGTTVDYRDGLEGRGFSFNNPNATKTCGCGSSFAT